MIGQSLEFLWCSAPSQQDLENYVNRWTSREFVGVALWESYKVNKHLISLVDLFNQKNVKVTVIMNSWSIKFQEEFNSLRCHVIYFDFFVWRTYNEIIGKKKSAVASHWNLSADKFLFLTGKPQKQNRIRLLYKFQQQGLLDRCVWSLHVPDGILEQTHSNLRELSLEQFQHFVLQFSRNPDNADVKIQPTNLHYGGIPYDVNLFAGTKFRVISETYMTQSHPFFTEKTWITILNRLPFIIAGDRYSCQELQNMGFKTFEQHVPVLNYDTIGDTEQRLNAIVEHTKYWLNNKMDDTIIAHDVEHNYNRFRALALETKNKLEQSLTNIGITDNIDHVISTIDQITNT